MARSMKYGPSALYMCADCNDAFVRLRFELVTVN